MSEGRGYWFRHPGQAWQTRKVRKRLRERENYDETLGNSQRIAPSPTNDDKPSVPTSDDREASHHPSCRCSTRQTGRSMSEMSDRAAEAGYQLTFAMLLMKAGRVRLLPFNERAGFLDDIQGDIEILVEERLAAIEANASLMAPTTDGEP